MCDFNACPVPTPLLHLTRPGTKLTNTTQFYINVWSIYKRGDVDVDLGLNTQIDLYWPVALQDEMLFEATLAVSRVGYCLKQHESPNIDQFALKHKGRALALLRNQMTSMAVVPTEAIIFTVSRMLAISYMTMDNAAFQYHFTAFQQLAQNYKLDESRRVVVERVMAHRLKRYARIWLFVRYCN